MVLFLTKDDELVELPDDFNPDPRQPGDFGDLFEWQKKEPGFWRSLAEEIRAGIRRLTRPEEF